MQGDISSRTSAVSSFTNALSRMKTRDCSTWVFMQNLPNKQKNVVLQRPFCQIFHTFARLLNKYLIKNNYSIHEKMSLMDACRHPSLRHNICSDLLQ